MYYARYIYVAVTLVTLLKAGLDSADNLCRKVDAHSSKATEMNYGLPWNLKRAALHMVSFVN